MDFGFLRLVSIMSRNWLYDQLCYSVKRTTMGRSGSQTRLISFLLLILLVSNIFHSYLHGCPVAPGAENWPRTGNGIFTHSRQGSAPTYGKAPPCLACACQKHKLAVPLSSHSLPGKPNQIDYCLIEPQHTFKTNPLVKLDSSRAPPLLG